MIHDDTRVKLAVLGLNFGAGIARNLAGGNSFVELRGLCDLDKVKGLSLAQELGIPFFDNLQLLLEDKAIEAVGVFTAPAGRAALLDKVLRADKHVMTTKPFELDVAAARAVLEDARARKLAVHSNSPAPVPSEDLEQIQLWIEEFHLGRPIGMQARTWASYHEQATGTWYDDVARCPAAPIFRLGIYFLNDFAAFMGEPTRVQVVQARVRTGRPTADNAQLSIEFKGGALANIFASFCIDDGEPWRDEVVLNFERGTIYRWVDRARGPDMSTHHAVLELRCPGARKSSSTQPGAYAGWYNWEAFRDAIRGRGKAPLQNAEQILFGVRLLAAMTRSAQTSLPEPVHTE